MTEIRRAILLSALLALATVLAGCAADDEEPAEDELANDGEEAQEAVGEEDTPGPGAVGVLAAGGVAVALAVRRR